MKATLEELKEGQEIVRMSLERDIEVHSEYE
jgi:hypothetical protein